MNKKIRTAKYSIVAGGVQKIRNSMFERVKSRACSVSSRVKSRLVLELELSEKLEPFWVLGTVQGCSSKVSGVLIGLHDKLDDLIETHYGGMGRGIWWQHSRFKLKSLTYYCFSVCVKIKSLTFFIKMTQIFGKLKNLADFHETQKVFFGFLITNSNSNWAKFWSNSIWKIEVPMDVTQIKKKTDNYF